MTKPGPRARDGGPSWRRRGRAWLVAAVLFGAASGCATVPREAPTAVVYATAEARAQAQVAVLEQAWRLAERRFYASDFNGAEWATARERHREAAANAGDVEAFYAVLNAMLAELDDAHTGAFTPRESWENFWAERAFVGLNLSWLDHAWVVDEVRPGSAAEAAGVHAGWLVLNRDGAPLPDEFFDLKTEQGRTYTWEFLDEAGRRVTHELLAERLPDLMPPEEKGSDEGWIYLRFDEFVPMLRDWLRERLAANAGAPGIILDLRRNGGGEVATLERVLRDLLPGRVRYGTFVTRGGRVNREKSAWLGGTPYVGPLAVLVGPGSASSAEILAYSLQHYGRARLFGETTAGVVIASQFFRLRDGGELQLGTFDFRTLDGKRLEGNGVKPDEEVKRTLPAVRAGRDEVLAAAVTWLRTERAMMPSAVRGADGAAKFSARALVNE